MLFLCKEKERNIYKQLYHLHVQMRKFILFKCGQYKIWATDWV